MLPDKFIAEQAKQPLTLRVIPIDEAMSAAVLCRPAVPKDTPEYAMVDLAVEALNWAWASHDEEHRKGAATRLRAAIVAAGKLLIEPEAAA